jgi:hypothetical protein
MKFEIVTSVGRGVHLANLGQHQALCTRPVLQRTGREGSITTPHLCQACGRVLTHLAQAGGRPLEPLSAPPPTGSSAAPPSPASSYTSHSTW